MRQHLADSPQTSAALRAVLPAAGLLLLAACASGGAPSAPSLPSPPSVPSASPPSLPSASPPAAPAPPTPPGASRSSRDQDAGKHDPGEADPGEGREENEGGEGEAAPPGSAETADERRAGVEQKLDASLAEFDRLLLREKEILAEQRDGAMSASGGSAAGGAGDGGELGEEGASESPEDNPSRTSGASPSAPTGSHRAPGSPEDADAEEEEDPSRIPPDIPSGNDDDIVARQLREAAMNEEDPELREKLWDEYRKYKGIQK